MPGAAALPGTGMTDSVGRQGAPAHNETARAGGGGRAGAAGSPDSGTPAGLLPAAPLGSAQCMRAPGQTFRHAGGEASA